MTARLAFDFAPTAATKWLGRATTRTHRMLSVCIFIVAAGAFATAVLTDVMLRAHLAALQTELSAHEQSQLSMRSKAQAATHMSKQQILAHNTLVSQLNTPWPAIFDMLERSTPDSVALVQIDPDGLRRTIRIQVEARSNDDALAYASRLKNDSIVERVSLVEQETNERDPTRPVRVTLDARLTANAVNAGAQGK